MIWNVDVCDEEADDDVPDDALGGDEVHQDKVGKEEEFLALLGWGPLFPCFSLPSTCPWSQLVTDSA